MYSILLSTIDNNDYSFPSFPVSFSAGGPSTFQFDIMLNDDNDFEGDHSFSISFTGGTFVNMGTIPEAIVVITDFDGKPLCAHEQTYDQWTMSL